MPVLMRVLVLSIVLSNFSIGVCSASVAEIFVSNGVCSASKVTIVVLMEVLVMSGMTVTGWIGDETRKLAAMLDGLDAMEEAMVSAAMAFMGMVVACFHPSRKPSLKMR